eukprot:9386-Rhodomonas_salina.5
MQPPARTRGARYAPTQALGLGREGDQSQVPVPMGLRASSGSFQFLDQAHGRGMELPERNGLRLLKQVCVCRLVPKIPPQHFVLRVPCKPKLQHRNVFQLCRRKREQTPLWKARNRKRYSVAGASPVTVYKASVARNGFSQAVPRECWHPFSHATWYSSASTRKRRTTECVPASTSSGTFGLLCWLDACSPRTTEEGAAP